jgi:hypothetical protein
VNHSVEMGISVSEKEYFFLVVSRDKFVLSERQLEVFDFLEL